MSETSWFLRKVKLSNILGFSGQREIAFCDGLQVIEAHNHTGKTSLAIALLWGLTGQLPSIDRISASQFKLKNKLADDKEKAEIEILLENSKGEKLQIIRSAKSTNRNTTLSVKMNEGAFADDDAQAILYKLLGLKPQSLEGCCIVLQDHRLSLITGDQKKSSAAIHDILGLSMLASLVPIINKKLSELKKVVKDFEGSDPKKKWEERLFELSNELKLKEEEAIKKGFGREIFNSPDYLNLEFQTLYQSLAMPNRFEGKSPKELVGLFRQELHIKRNQNPCKAKRDVLTGESNLVKESLLKVEKVNAEIKEIERNYSETVNHYKVDIEGIVQKIQACENEIASKQAAYDRLKEQNGLLTYSLSVLSKQDCKSSCPVCQQTVDYRKLMVDIQSKLGDSIKKSLEEYAQDLERLFNSKRDSEKLQLEFKELENNLKRALGNSLNALEALGDNFKLEFTLIQQTLNEKFLNKISEISRKFENLGQAVRNRLIQINAALEQADTFYRKFDQDLIPLESKLDNIAMYLIPINDIHIKLEDHAKSKIEKENQSKEYVQLLDIARGNINQLEEFKAYLQNQEKDKANQIIAEHQDFASNFFVKVAANPHYDKISIKAEEDRGSVKYDFEASSTKNPTFTDSAKHVLSGGDLSVACLGLMLSLTKGKSNKAGFLVLDDPGESFDLIRMDNFAKTIQSSLGHQTIILTHQSEFAEKLRNSGAASINL